MGVLNTVFSILGNFLGRVIQRLVLRSYWFKQHTFWNQSKIWTWFFSNKSFIITEQVSWHFDSFWILKGGLVGYRQPNTRRILVNQKYIPQLENKTFEKFSFCFNVKYCLNCVWSCFPNSEQLFFWLRGSRARTPKFLGQIMHFLEFFKGIDASF